MPSYVITGASRGIGLEFVKQISARPDTQVFGLVRNKATASALQSLANSKTNVHILQADVVDHTALKKAAAEVSKITGGKLDVLINNAAYVPSSDATTLALTQFEGKEDLLEKEMRGSIDINVIGVIYTTNAFLPLLRAGSTKKVITISSGVASTTFTEQSGLIGTVPYTVSKVAVNMVNTKYAVQFKEEGFVFLALSPGLVDTAVRDKEPTPEELEGFKALLAMFQKVKPSLTGPITPTESVQAQLKVIDNVTAKDSGAFVSHQGNQDWL